MSSEDRHKNEDFNLEIDSAVESFFSRYEENAPKMDVPSHETESDAISEEETAPEAGISLEEPESEPVSAEENAPENDGSSLETVFSMLSEKENESGTDGSPDEVETDTDQKEEKASPEDNKIGSGLHAKKKFDPTATHVFNSLTEAILTVDWEVNEASVNEALKIIEEIQAKFPILNESRTKDIIAGMQKTLGAIAASPQRVPTSATAQLEKAIPILRGIATGAQMEEGYEELIEDALAGLESCRVENEPAVDEKADSSSQVTDHAIPFDSGEGEGLEDEALEPIAVPAGVSSVLGQHSKVVAQMTTRAGRLTQLYTAAQGPENVEEVLQKINGLLELQTRAFQDVFSLECDIAIFPVGKIKKLSDFIDFQRMAMGACLRHARVLEKAFKKYSHRQRFWRSIYFLRIAMEKQIDELSRADRDDEASARETEFTVPAPL